MTGRLGCAGCSVGDRIQILVGGTGHYLNSRIQFAGSILELIRTYGEGIDGASGGY